MSESSTTRTGTSSSAASLAARNLRAPATTSILVILDDADKQGLQHSLRGEARSQFRKAVLIEAAAWIGGGFLQLYNGQVAIFIVDANCGRHDDLLLSSEKVEAVRTDTLRLSAPMVLVRLGGCLRRFRG